MKKEVVKAKHFKLTNNVYHYPDEYLKMDIEKKRKEIIKKEMIKKIR